MQSVYQYAKWALIELSPTRDPDMSGDRSSRAFTTTIMADPEPFPSSYPIPYNIIIRITYHKVSLRVET